MTNNLRKLISLIPIENDDQFYDVYHRNSSSKKKLNLILKKPLNLEISNFTPKYYQLNYTLEKYVKKHNFLPKIPKVNLKFKQEENLTNIPTSNNSLIYHKPIEDEKSKVRQKISPKKSKLTINNIILQEDYSYRNNLSKSSSNQNIIYLEKKKHMHELTKKIINKEYEKEMKQFKVYSKNMNEMIANQMVLEFLRRTRNLQKLQSDDLMINYIVANNNKNLINMHKKNRISTSESSNIESEEISNQNNSHNLIIHNVFFEWVISNVIQRYVNEINPLNKNASIKFIRNLLLDEVKTLSTLFFYRKKEKKDEKDLPRNMRIVRNIFGKYKLRHDNYSSSQSKIKRHDIDFELDIKREEIKKKLIEKIIEKIVENEEEQLTKTKNTESDIKINNRRVDLQNFGNNRRLIFNDGYNDYENENDLEIINNKDPHINKRRNRNYMRNENLMNNVVQKVSVETNTDSSLYSKYNDNNE